VALRRGGSGVAVALALALSGCSADTAMFRRDWNWWSNSRPPPMQAAPADGLIGPENTCPEAAHQPRNVALGMTECDLIRLAGPTDQVAVSKNERGERMVVITYPQGERAGIYRFVSGLLVSVDRVPEPPGPARRKNQKKKKAQSTQG
jgi:hypothetical protein